LLTSRRFPEGTDETHNGPCRGILRPGRAMAQAVTQYHLEDEQQACWWPQFTDTVSLHDTNTLGPSLKPGTTQTRGRVLTHIAHRHIPWASVIGHRENVTLGPGPNVTAEVTCYWPRSWDAHVMTSAVHAQHHNKSVTCSTDFEFMQQ
jgi:hypothetical protein